MNSIIKCQECKNFRAILRLLRSYQKLFEQISAVTRKTETKIRIYERFYAEHFEAHLEEIKDEE